jgi:glycosyltransferase involved in cell wall biosynthesis
VARLRVLLSFPTRIGTPGIGTTAWYQAAGLARQGAEVHVVCGSVERDLPGVHVDGETMRLFGHNVPYRPLGVDRAMAFHDRRVERMLLRSGGPFDVVHAWPGGGERTLRAARAVGVPAFLERPNSHTAAGFEIVQAECARLGLRLERSSPHAFNAKKLAREEREFAAADALLCPSDVVAASHAARGTPDSRLLRHRYGYDPERFGPPRGRRPPNAPLTVVFLGRLEPRKGVHLALEAWRSSDIGAGARLLLCGKMEPGYESILGPLIDQPGVELRGAVSDPAGILKGSDVLVLPSLEEGSALVTYEARASGAILLISDRTGAVATHGYDALVHPAGQQETLARHFRWVAQNHELRETLRTNSLTGISDLTWDAAAEALLEAYAIGAARIRQGSDAFGGFESSSAQASPLLRR